MNEPKKAHVVSRAPTPIEKLAHVLYKPPSVPPAAPKAQSTAAKIEILASECGLQAVDATRAGRALDAAEWRYLRAWIKGL